MRIDILTLFPEMCEAVLGESIVGRARKKELVTVECHNIRDFAGNKHNRVDDYTYGGGTGMVMQPGPVYDCYAALCGRLGTRPHLVYLSPQGRSFDEAMAVRFAGMQNLALLCGHYEGLDERVIEEIVDEEVSIGDFVLTGGELPALCVADAVIRLLPGVLREEQSYREESHYSGLLEYPQYTRPPVFHGRSVPAVLLSGHQKNIDVWRREQSLQRTLARRPDLIEKAEGLTKSDLAFLKKAEAQDGKNGAKGE